MKDKHTFLAFDIGATSGRSVVGTIENNKLKFEELTRFSNNILNIHGKRYWNIYSLYEELKNSLQRAREEGITIDSIGIDTWGVDFVFLSREDTILELPRSYRDSYTEGIPERLFKSIPREELYELTGIQIMDFNTLFQLYAVLQQDSSVLESATHILFIPDALSFLLTGQKVCEYTIASTSQLLDPRSKTISEPIDRILNIKEKLPDIILPGNKVGMLLPDIAEECKIDAIPIFAVASHDTASAIVAVPAKDKNFAYISSGTWSLMGIEVDEPIITRQSFENNFTNERGVENTIRFLKNIAGMWLLEECRREWKQMGKDYPYEKIVSMAESAEAFRFLVDPDDKSFVSPISMIESIQQYCKATEQGIPASDAEIIRCIFDSLALKYRYVFELLQEMAPFEINTMHVIGGGAQNKLLNQLTANSLNILVIAGPSEATAIGNIMMQAKGMNLVKDLAGIRAIVRDSTSLKEFTPQETAKWDEQYERYKTIIRK